MKNKKLEEIIRRSGDATAIDISVTTGSGKDEITGASEWRSRIVVRVKEKPIQGTANAATVRLFSEILGVPAKDLRITSGKKSSLKTIMVERDIEEVKVGLAQILGED
jgi:uncharacterized protein (TIGR00251 family)